MTTDGKYPQCEKMSEVHEFSQRCGEFILWLNTQHGIMLAKYDTIQDACRNCEHEDAHDERVVDSVTYGERGCSFENDTTGECCDCRDADFGNPNRLYLQNVTIVDLLAEFFDIDQQALETEKRQMLAEMREANHATSR